MMDKEIIIDGVNVAGCEYMLNNKIKGKQHCPAKAMPYAKETSCICRKSIDTPYNFCKHNPNCHYKQLKRLEFELKVTKADYEASEQENARLKENDCEQCKHLDLYIKYKQTLQEIKEIAEPIYEDYGKRWDDNVTEGLEQILQKISDCEEE